MVWSGFTEHDQNGSLKMITQDASEAPHVTAIVIISEESCRLLGVDLVAGAGQAPTIEGQFTDPRHR